MHIYIKGVNNMKKCKICGGKEELKEYKRGHICEDCIKLIKSQTKNKTQ